MADPTTVPEGYIEKVTPDGQRHWFKVGTPEDEMMATVEADQPPSTLEGLVDLGKSIATSGAVKSIGTGAVRGAAGVAGTAGDYKALANALLDKVTPAALMPPEQPPERQPRLGAAPTSDKVLGAIEENVTGELYEPQGFMEKLIAKGTEFVPNIAAGPGGLGRKAVTQVIAPALGNEAAGQASEGTWYEPYARLVGELLGGITPSTIEHVGLPAPPNPRQQRLINIAEQQDIPLTAGDRTGNEKLQYMESELGGAAYRRAKDTQKEAISRAATRPIGAATSSADPDVMRARVQDMGREFDRLQSGTAVPLDQQLQNDLLNANIKHQAVAGTPSKGAEYMMNRIAELAAQNGGVLQGEAFKNIRSEMGEWIAAGDPATKQVLRDLQESLDDAVERNMSPRLRSQWQTVRNQYRHYMVLEDAMAGPGRDIAQGLVPAERLRAPAVAQNQRGYVTGGGTYSDLAHLGEGLLRSPPQSGTSARGAARAIPAAVAGGATQFLTGEWGLGTAAAGAAALAAPAVAGRVAMRPSVQRYLASQTPDAWSADARRQALLQALIAPRLFAPQEE